ncbi:hypothetical protein OC842_004453 [Tilletia horrida]|uniref:Cytochrome b561 domain-containing protein n=1 Tax=Tilletia horrida TaxID=155126 RepID=A0AAN6G9C3_9BASI|nr:hypothetical protein OC842_004453 [Tilletia horrida]KAK0563103.1 hypothetical protein OC844_002372 [Tilletia horrida]
MPSISSLALSAVLASLPLTAATDAAQHGDEDVLLLKRDTSPSRDLSLPSTRVIIAHITFMIAGWMLTIPLGALIARYGRTYFRWFPTHRAIQLLGLLFVTVGFALAVEFHMLSPGLTHFSTRHGQLGLAIFILGWFQALIGQVGHRLLHKHQLRYLSFFHILFGITLFGLAVYQVSLGFQEWLYLPPSWVPNVFYGWAGLVFLLYAFGFTLLPRELRQKRAAEAQEAGPEEEGSATAPAAAPFRKASVASSSGDSSPTVVAGSPTEESKNKI